MTRDEGIKRITKLYGKKAMWSDTKRPTSPEQREEASVLYQAAHAKKKALSEAMNARSIELLRADPQYQQLKTEHAAAYADEKKAGNLGGFRLSVGENVGFAFMVRAQGDNWSDVVKKAESVRGKEWA